MGENIYSWSTTAASNGNADGSINWAENQAPSTVNNSARSMMAAHAKFLADNNGTLTSGGSSNAYTLSANVAYTALATGLMVSFKASFANTGASTLTLTPSGGAAFAAKAIRVFRGGVDSALTGGEIPASYHPILHYDAAANSSAGAWILINPAVDNESGDIIVTNFGAVSGESNSRDDFQAAMTAAASKQRVVVPAGTWTLGSALTYSSTYPTWVGQPGLVMTDTSLTRMINSSMITPASWMHSWETARATTDGQECFKFYGLYVPSNTGTVDHERETLFVLCRTDDNEQAVGSVYKAAVGISSRAYVASSNAHGRAFGINPYALIESGGEGIIVGAEIDLAHSATASVTPYSGNVKTGLIISNVGPNDSTCGIEIAGEPWWFGLVMTQDGIKNHADARSISLQNGFTVDRNGHTTVGKETHNRQTRGIELVYTGEVWISSANASAANLIFTQVGNSVSGTLGLIAFQGNNSSGTLKPFGNFYVSIASSAAGSETSEIILEGIDAGSAFTALAISKATFRPGTDNTSTCGHASFRWSVVYAGTGTINTSDELLKTDIENIGEPELDAWGESRAQFYRWKDAKEAKGEGARIHAGWIAQRVVGIFEKHGIDPWRLAMFCRDDILIERKTVKTERRQKMVQQESKKEDFQLIDGKMVRSISTETIEVPATEDHPLFDESGEPITHEVKVVVRDEDGAVLTKAVTFRDADGKEQTAKEPVTRIEKRQMIRATPIFEDVEVETIERVPSGEYRYGLRYEQCLLMETAWQRRRGDRLEQHLAALEARLEKAGL